MSYVEHVLIAETGTEETSRYLVVAGVRIDDPAAAAERLQGAGEDRVLALLRDTAFEIRIAFASKQKLEAIGDDWRYEFLRYVMNVGFHPTRFRQRREGFPMIAHLPEDAPFDFEWLSAYLTANVWRARFQTRIHAPDAPLLALPALVARLFHDAIESERGRACSARDRYDGISSLVSHIEDVGLNVSYPNGVVADAILRGTLSS